MRRLILLALGCVAGFAVTFQAKAQIYPSHPITIIVPLAPGGSTDVIGRIMAEGMRAALGQPVIVENTSGAGGTIGVGRVARVAPDGYTIGIGQWGTNVANGAIYALPYDLLKDFEPIALVATQPFLIVARKTMPANNLHELVAWLKGNADKATGGNSGVGTPSHVGGILFQNAIGTRFQMVPYRSAGQTMQGLLAGDSDVALPCRCRSCAVATSKPMPSPPRTRCRRRRIFPPPTRRDCRASIFPSGTRFGHPKVRQRT